MTGRIVKALSGFYYVDCDGEIIQCKPRGKFRYEKVSPLVGDRVDITPTEPGKGRLDTGKTSSSAPLWPIWIR